MARRRSQPQTTDGESTPPPKAKRPRKGIWREVRELWDTLVLAFVLVTLMKTFVVDLYKIPSGSMTNGCPVANTCPDMSSPGSRRTSRYTGQSWPT